MYDVCSRLAEEEGVGLIVADRLRKGLNGFCSFFFSREASASSLPRKRVCI